MPFKRALALLACAHAPLLALKLSLTQGKEKDQDFATLTLTHASPFACTQAPLPPKIITCVIHSIPKPGFTPLKTPFFDISYEMKNYVFYLHIQPKFQQQLFAIPYDYKQHIPIQRITPTTSKAWQIVGFIKKIPFLSPANPFEGAQDGLNFPIIIEDAQTPYIQELGADNKPLHYSKGADIEGYLQVKKLMQEQSYLSALKTIGSIFQSYPNTLFRKDLYLYEIIALDKLNRRQDLLLQIGEQWLKFYPADPEIPQVLYLMGTAYARINHIAQARIQFEHVVIEYANSRYAPLSQMRLAQQTANEGNQSGALAGFRKAYSQAKDIESASLITFSWAQFDLDNYKGKHADALMNKILQANPAFFLQDMPRSYDMLLRLKTNALFKPAIKIARILANQDSDPVIREKAAFELGFLYAKNNQPNEAHTANLDYLDHFNNPVHTSLVKQRDEQILFLMHGDFEEKLARYNQIIKDYPRNSKEHKKALDYKARMLLSERYYSQVLAMAPDLPLNSEPMQEALLHLGKNAVKEGDCKSAVSFLVQVVPLDPEQFEEDDQLEAFDCFYNAKLYNQAAIFSKNGLQKKPENSEDRLKWLYRQGKNLYALKNYQDSLLASKDALTLATLNKQKRYYDIAFVVFLDYMHTNNPQEAFKIFPKLQEWFKDDARMLEVYGLLLQNEEKSTNNPTTLELYAKNAIALQKQYQSDAFMPYAQEQLISALMRQNKLEQALQASSTLLANKQLEPKERARTLYMQGSIFKQQNKLDKAQQAFEACNAIKVTSGWIDLCRQALNLLKP
ncbi:flagellar protein [Helicobacter baculiformis]|uniref:Flagellar protein n=1 Tax=Helicobacter baculiformis TaxID=427351 RepID=A0ABV7ZGS4_9HELI|nr:flagellar protein [Helicobacter baculiformis]